MMNSRLSSKVAAFAVGRGSSAVGVRSMSASANVWVNKDTRVICQGFTGKQVGRERLCCRGSIVL